ncbi:MAG: class I SAM-dependent methyltransferase [bacterium]
MEIQTSKNILDQVSNYSKKYHQPDDYDYFLFHQHRYLILISFIQKYYQPENRFLDIGSHLHYITLAAKIIGYEVFGIDLFEYVEKTKDIAMELEIDNRSVDLGYDKLPFQDNFFNVINFSETLEHFNFHPQKVFNEMFRVLKFEGKVIISTPNLLRLNNRIKLMIGQSIHSDLNEKYGSGTHYREYSSQEIKILLEQSGFTKYNLSYINFNYPNANPFVRFIGNIVSFFFKSLKSNLLIIAEK